MFDAEFKETQKLIFEGETRSPRGSYYVKGEDQPTTNDVARQSCLSLRDMHEYLQSKSGYGWHISNLKIYDELKELGKFSCGSSTLEWSKTRDGFPWKWSGMKRPPQSWGYVEELW